MKVLRRPCGEKVFNPAPLAPLTQDAENCLISHAPQVEAHRLDWIILESHPGLEEEAQAHHRKQCGQRLLGTKREMNPKDKKAEAVWEVATKKAVKGTPHEGGTGRDSQTGEGGERFTEPRRISVNHEAKIREER